MAVTKEPQTVPGDAMGLRGHFLLILRGPDGHEKDRREGSNIITTAGKQAGIARLIDGTSTPAIFNYVAIGTSGTGEGVGDTALLAEVGTRQQDTDATPDPPSPTGQQQLIVTFAAGNGTGTIQEAGVLNNSSGGTLLNRKTFGAITKGAGDSLEITVTLTLS
jgi:hypothetical protein